MKKINQYDLEGNLIKPWKSIAQAAKYYSIDESCIRKAANKSGVSVGYIWKHDDTSEVEEVEETPQITLPKVLILDIETSPLKLYHWRVNGKQRLSAENILESWLILTYAAKWLYSAEVISDRLTDEEIKGKTDLRIAINLWNLLQQADIVVAHNGEKFDMPMIYGRFFMHGIPPVKPIRIIDTYKASSNRFDLPSHKLDFIGTVLGLGKKLETTMQLWRDVLALAPGAIEYMEEYNKRDVTLLEEVYLKMRAWIPGHPNIALYNDVERDICPVCGSTHIIPEPGYFTTMVGKYPLFRCTKCFKISRSRKSVIAPDKSKHLLTHAF